MASMAEALVREEERLEANAEAPAPENPPADEPIPPRDSGGALEVANFSIAISNILQRFPYILSDDIILAV